MPSSKRTSTRKKGRGRRGVARRRGHKTGTVSITRGGTGFPNKIVMKHKYVELVGLSITSGAKGTYTFSCNNMWDPNVSSIGHQPLYRDQLAAIYNHYTVIGARIKVSFTNASSTYTTPVYCTVYVDDDNAVTNAALVGSIEQKGARVKYLSNSGEPAVLISKWSAKRTFGGSVLSNNQLTASVGSSPTEQSYFILGVQPNDSSTITINALVELEYITVWSELTDIGSS